jgi:hypothetical protein
MEHYLQANAVPPENVKQGGSVESSKGPGWFFCRFDAVSRRDWQEEFRESAGFAIAIGVRYQDRTVRQSGKNIIIKNLALFALGFMERRFWFNSQGALQPSSKHS